jgi:3-oxoadipate enol-lactonase
MPFARLADGAELHYTEYCYAEPWTEPEPLVLVHGFCRNSRFWYAWIPVLARHFRVLAPDLRGCGKSPVPAPGFKWSLEQYRQDLMGFLDALGIRSAHFVGESMGGMVMPYVNSKAPERVRSVTCCSSNLGLRGPMAKEMAGGAASMVEAIASAPTLEHYVRRTEASRLAPEEADEAARAWYAREWATTPRRVWQEWSEQIVPQIDVTPELLAQLRAPLLFIAPTRCVKLPPEEAHFWVEHAPNARLAWVDAASQALAFAHADACAALALDFLRQPRASAA